MAEILHISSTARKQVVDLTDQDEAVIRKAKMQEGLCSLFITHMTAALTAGEVGEGTEQDFLQVVEQMIPRIQYRHAHARQFGEIIEGRCRTLLHRVFLSGLIWEGVQMASAKEQMLEVLRNQPDDSSYNELLRELAFAQMVERGLGDSDAGRTISHEDMLSRIRSWQR